VYTCSQTCQNAVIYIYNCFRLSVFEDRPNVYNLKTLRPDMYYLCCCLYNRVFLVYKISVNSISTS